MRGGPVGVVVNLNASRHRRDAGVLARIKQTLGTQGILEKSRSETDLERIAERFRREGVRVLAISGGDGTAGSTLSALRTIWDGTPLPDVALLRGGTMNTVANGIGVPWRAPDAILGALLQALDRGETTARERATIEVRGRLGFLFGTGVFASFLADYYARGKGSPTVWTAARTLGAMAASVAVGGRLARKLVAQELVGLVIDGERWECPSRAGYMTVAAGTVAQAGLGFRPFRRADERADAFHLLAVHVGALATLRVLPAVRRGEQIPIHSARDALAREVCLEPVNKPLRYMLDGELGASDDSLVLRAGPAVRILRPLAGRAPAW